MNHQEAELEFYGAVERGDVEAARDVLDRHLEMEGALVHNYPMRGKTALARAAERGHAAMVAFLLERGADADDGRFPPLYYAIERGHEHVIDMLFDHGARTRWSFGFGGPGRASLALHVVHPVIALWHAMRCYHLGVLKKVLEHTEDEEINTPGAFGFTPLWMSCSDGDAPKARVLLQAGADPDIPNRGKTPRQVAEEKGHVEVIRLFEWWETEPERAYLFHRARCLYEEGKRQDQSTAAPVPIYLEARVQNGDGMPSVEVVESRKAGDEEEQAVLQYAIKGLPTELFTELMEGMRLK